jgi:hypothetical protein
MVIPEPLTRVYQDVLRRHLAEETQMAFVSGGRQVGKTTVCQSLASADAYLSWDVDEDRNVLRHGQAIVDRLGLARARAATGRSIRRAPSDGALEARRDPRRRAPAQGGRRLDGPRPRALRPALPARQAGPRGRFPRGARSSSLVPGGGEARGGAPHKDLARYQDAPGAAHAFQVVLELPYEGIDVFEEHRPVVVPARTLLSQIL